MNTHFLPSQNNPKTFTSEPLSPAKQRLQQHIVFVKQWYSRIGLDWTFCSKRAYKKGSV